MKRFGLTLLLLVLLVSPVLATPVVVTLDTASNRNLGVPTAGRYVNGYPLVANTAKTITVPDGVNYVSISGTEIWVNWIGVTAAVPSSDITDGTASVRNTGVRFIGVMTGLSPITSFSVISATAQQISVECWK